MNTSIQAPAISTVACLLVSFSFLSAHGKLAAPLCLFGGAAIQGSKTMEISFGDWMLVSAFIELAMLSLVFEYA